MKKDDFIICMPSYKRAEILLSNKKNPLSFMDSEMLESTIIFVRKEEAQNYKKVLEKFKGLQLHILDSCVSNMGNTRDNILKYCYNKKYEKILMIDDDIVFRKRTNNYTLQRVIQNKEMFNKMVYTLFKKCNKDIPLIGINHDAFNGCYELPYNMNTRIIQVFCIHLPTLKENNITFMDCNLWTMTDYYFTLKLLTLGYKNMCINIYSRSDTMQTPGGCSEYRTKEMEEQSAKTLKKLFPDFISLYYKQSGTWDISRIAIRVKWQKAFNKKLYEERSKK